jgi:hypothetical protein
VRTKEEGRREVGLLRRGGQDTKDLAATLK